MSNEDRLTKPASDGANAVEETRCGCYYRPNVDILEKDDELIVLADVPGASPEDIDVDFEDGTLTIDAKAATRVRPGSSCSACLVGSFIAIFGTPTS